MGNTVTHMTWYRGNNEVCLEHSPFRGRLRITVNGEEVVRRTVWGGIVEPLWVRNEFIGTVIVEFCRFRYRYKCDTLIFHASMLGFRQQHIVQDVSKGTEAYMSL